MAEALLSIRYTADVIVLRGKDLLLIERGWPPYQGKLALPGGHVDPGETSRSAAARELREETGVHADAEALELLGVWDAPERDPRGRYVTAVYLVHVPADTQAHAGDDAAGAFWVPLHDRQLRDLAFDHSDIVYTVWNRELDRMNAAYERQGRQGRQTYPKEAEGRCPAAHPSDSSGCAGPRAVTVVDRMGGGAEGCEHHAARMLASLTDARVYALPDAESGAALRVFRIAGALPPYVWLQPLQR